MKLFLFLFALLGMGFALNIGRSACMISSSEAIEHGVQKLIGEKNFKCNNGVLTRIVDSAKTLNTVKEKMEYVKDSVSDTLEKLGNNEAREPSTESCNAEKFFPPPAPQPPSPENPAAELPCLF